MRDLISSHKVGTGRMSAVLVKARYSGLCLQSQHQELEGETGRSLVLVGQPGFGELQVQTKTVS